MSSNDLWTKNSSITDNIDRLSDLLTQKLPLSQPSPRFSLKCEFIASVLYSFPVPRRAWRKNRKEYLHGYQRRSTEMDFWMKIPCKSTLSKKSIASIVLTYWFGTVPLRTGVGGGWRGRCIIKSLSIPLAHTVYIHNMLRHKQWRETYRMYHSITPRIRSKKATNG